MDEIKGIVINSLDYKEKSKIVYLYTPFGHDSVRVNSAKDIKKGYLSFITTLNIVSYLKTNSKFPSLLEYTVLESNYDICDSVSKIDALTIILKLIKLIPNDADHERIFNFILQIINYLKIHNPKKVLCLFLVKLLYAFGISPNFKNCIKCKNTNISYFSILEGGAICINCTKNNNVDLYNIWKEYYYDKKDINDYNNIDFDIFLSDIFKYYEIHADIKLN